MSTAEYNKQKMIEVVEKELPNFVKLIKTSNEEMIIFPQNAFAADYQENEFALLGMAIKYAGLYNREITIIPNK
ncbi:MAG TPA: hypothetical protein VGB84_01920 [Arachidicoccus sp.]